MDIGKNLRVAQLVHGKSNKKVAEDLNIPVQMIHRWRYAKDIKLSRAKQLADYFGITLDEFVRFTK